MGDQDLMIKLIGGATLAVVFGIVFGVAKLIEYRDRVKARPSEIWEAECLPLLHECRNILGDPPRRPGAWVYHTYWRGGRPVWITRKDRLREFFGRQRELMQEGRVVWGYITQAYSILFERSTYDPPADVVYCPDPSIKPSPVALHEIAKRIHNLKLAAVDDPSLRALAEHLADDLDSALGLPVPESISPDFPAELTTIFVRRGHLPVGRLTRNYFPLLISEREPRVAMILPSRYWPERLIEDWKRG